MKKLSLLLLFCAAGLFLTPALSWAKEPASGGKGKKGPRPVLLKPLSPTLAAPPASSSLARIIRSRILRVCVRSDAPPFGYFASSGLVGFDVGLARELAVKLSIYYKRNLQIAWSVVAAGERISRLQKKGCDVVAGAFSYTPARARKVAFSHIYLQTNQVVFSQKTITRKEPVVAVVRGTTAKPKAIDTQATIRYFKNYKEIIYAMENDEVDYVVADMPIALHMIRSVSRPFQITKTLPQQERYALGVHRSHPHLLRALNRALRELARSGRLAYLRRQWL